MKNGKDIQLIDIKEKSSSFHSQSSNEEANRNDNEVKTRDSPTKRQSVLNYFLFILSIGILTTYIIKSIELYRLENEFKEVQYLNNELNSKKAQLEKRSKDLVTYFEEVTEQYNDLKDEKKAKKQMLHQILHPYATDIIQSPEELKKLRLLLKEDGKVGLRLMYQAKPGNDTSAQFHFHTDQMEDTLIFVETTQGARFGGFTRLNFQPHSYVDFTNPLTKSDKDSFVFSFDKNKKWFIDPLKEDSAIYCDDDLGPYFGEGDIRINSPFFSKPHQSLFPTTFQGSSEDKLALTNGQTDFRIKHFEVYQVFFPES